jgi:tetratricopeptide (TPR) repeat protein
VTYTSFVIAFPRTLSVLAIAAAIAPALPKATFGQTVHAVLASDAISSGDSLIQAFRTREALATYRAGLAAAPDDPVLLWKTARALATLSAESPDVGNDEALLAEAVSLARRAVRVGPDVARAHTTLAATVGLYGKLLAHKYRIRKAREVIAMGHEVHAHAKRAIELDPNDYAPYVILGIYHRELSTVHPLVKVAAKSFLGGWPAVSLDQSLAYLQKASRLAPRDVTTRLELARTLVAMERYEAAREELREVLALPPRENLDLVEQRKARELLTRIG